MQRRQQKRPPALLEAEAVAGEQLVGHGEADVAEVDVVHEPPVGAVEQRHRGKARRFAQLQRPHHEAEREPRVDDVLDDEHVASVDRGVEILGHPHAAAAPVGVAGQLDHVEGVVDRQRARQVGEEDGARLQRCDEQWLEALVVAGDLSAELCDPGRDLPRGEVDLPDRAVCHEASLRR